jgi:hypothetical protein
MKNYFNIRVFEYNQLIRGNSEPMLSIDVKETAYNSAFFCDYVKKVYKGIVSQFPENCYVIEINYIRIESQDQTPSFR